MAIDPTSPVGDLFFKMAGRLHDRRTGRIGARRWNRSLQRNQRGIRPPLELLHDYFVGDPQLNEVHQQWKAHVRQFIRMGRLNVAGMAITGSSNRMSLRGFRTSAANDETGDQEAHQLMVASGLPLASRDAIDSFLWAGDAYILCTPPGTRRPAPTATAEDPRQAITMDDPLTGLPRHGLKLFRSEWDDEDLAYLMIGYDPRQGLSGLEGQVLVARRKGSTSLVDRPFRVDAKGWEWDEDLFQTVPGKVMPMHHLRNRSGAGEFEHHLDSLDRINDKVFGEWWTAKIQAFRQRAVENLPEDDEKGEDIDYCMDEQTEVFTARGWLNGHDIREGDRVRSIDPVTGLARWQPVTSVYRRVGRTQMVRMASQSHDSMTTQDHRWLVNDVTLAGRRWVTTAYLNSRTRIIRAAMPSDAPQTSKYTDAFVELVAWWFTEGSYLSGGTPGGAISQSMRVNPHNCARIEAALQTALGAPHVRHDHTTPLTWIADPERANGVVVYRFGRDLHDALADVAPEKVPTTEFLSNLTAAQLRLFVATSLAADGHVSANASVLGQRDSRRTEAFATAAILAGMSVTYAPRPGRDGLVMHEVTVSDRRLHATVPGSHNQHRGDSATTCELVDYDGLIWCPTVAEDHNFLARRNGKTYYIDYTDMFTASPDEMWQVPADVKFWESTPVDLNPIINSIQKDLERVAGAMAIPLNQITPDAADGSAEGASLMREEHVYKINDRIERVSPPLVRVMANLFAFADKADRADPATIEAIFGPLERWSLAQRADAAAKLSGILPVESIWTDVLQYEPHEVPNLRTLRGRDRLYVVPPSVGGQPLADPGRTPAAPLPSTPPTPRALPPAPAPPPPGPAAGTQ